jgi:SNF2 family DNA or RNA helicase
MQDIRRIIYPVPKPHIFIESKFSLSIEIIEIKTSIDEILVNNLCNNGFFNIDCRFGRDLITALPIKSQIILINTQLESNIIEIPNLLKVNISDNLLFLFEEAKIFGMDYKNRIWREIMQVKIDEPRQKIQNSKSLSKSYTLPDRLSIEDEKPKPKGPSIWDFIYALLQPPLILGKTENLYLPHDLLKFQRPGIQFLMDNESALLADEMGTGKTVQTIVALRLLIQKGRVRSALVVCPLAVLRQWDEHMCDWAPDLLTTVIRGTPAIRTIDWMMPAHVYITTYDTLRNDIEKHILKKENLGKFDVVVLDEAQYIKNSDSGRAKATKKLLSHFRWALTGTPIENRIEDIVSIFNFLRPGYFSSFDLYPSRVKEKISPYFLRRRKEDVLEDLPPIIRQEQWLELDGKQRKAYDEALTRGQKELGILGEKVNRIDIFRILHELKQICNFAPGQLQSPKLNLLNEQIESIVDNGQKALVFSQYIPEGIEKIESCLKHFGLAKIVGSQTDRDAQVKRFQESKDIRILIASIRAGGIGLNLQAASYVIHFDHWWNPAVMWQAEGRAHRQGQKQTVNVYSYWIVDTIEEKIHRTLKEKGLLFADIIDGLSETNFENLISTEEWLEMLGVHHKMVSEPQKSCPLSLSISEIQEKLFSIHPSDFERIVKDLFRAFGYPNTKVTGRTGDGGLDVISTRNASNGILHIVAQCKRYRGTVGVEIARAFRGVIASDNRIEKGYLVTTGEFTRECITFCEKSNVIVTLNGIQTANYVKQFGIQI